MCKLEDELNEVAKEISIDYDLPVPEIELTNRFKSKLGECNRSTKLIRLNRFFCENNEFEAVYDLIKHEMAHFRARGHGDAFKGVCADMGIAHHTHIQHPDCIYEKGKFTYMCPGCGQFIHPFRRLKDGAACGDCCKGVYNLKFKLIDVTA